MNTQTTIEEKLISALSPQHMEVINESHKHNVPPGSESHFKVVVVSKNFADKPLLERHRLINRLLSEELQSGVHALSLHTTTPEEWLARHGEVPKSPPCLGGSPPRSDG